MIDSEKKYVVVADGKTYRFSEQDWSANMDEFMKDFPQAEIAEVESYKADDYEDNDNIVVRAGDRDFTFSGKDWKANESEFMKDFPDAQLARVRGVDYYYNQANKLDEELKAKDEEIKAWQDSRADRTGMDWSSVMMQQSGLSPIGAGFDPERDAALATYAAEGTRLQQERDEIQSRFDANPRVIEAREKAKQMEQEYEDNLLKEINATLTSYDTDKDVVETKMREIDARMSALDGQYGAILPQIGPSKETADKVRQFDKMGAAKEMIEHAKDIREGKTEGFWQGGAHFFEKEIEGIMYQTESDTMVQIAMILKDLNDKVGNLNKNLTPEVIDENLSKDDALLLRAYFSMMSAQKEVGTGWRYKAGEIAAAAIPFALEFAAIGGFADDVAKGATKGLQLGLERWVAEGIEQGGKAIGRKVGKYAAEIGTKGLIKAAMMTAMRPSTYSTIAQHLPTIDEEGNVKLGKNATIGALDSFIETISELSGGVIEDILGLGMKWGKGVTSKIFGDSVKNIKFGKWAKALTNGAFGDYLKQAGFHGLPTEIMEEYIGNTMRLIYDKDALKEMHEDGNGAAMWLGFVPMTLFGGAMSAGAFREVDQRAAQIGEKLNTLLLEKEFTKERADALTERRTDKSPLELGIQMNELREELKKKGATQEELEMVDDYAIAVAEFQTMRGVTEIREKQDLDEVRADLTRQYGTYAHNGNVTTAKTTDGRDVFVVSDKSATGEYAAVDMQTGQHITISDADIATQNNAQGQPVQALTSKPENQYIGDRLLERNRLKEAERKLQERNEQIAKINELMPDELNLGTEGEPNMVVVKSKDAKGVTVVNAEGGEAQMSWDAVGRVIGLPIHVFSDMELAEMEAQEIALKREALRAARAKTYAENNNVSAEIEQIKKKINDVAPKPEAKYTNKQTGEVDEVSFWENDPEGYCDWNDRQNNDGGVDSIEQLENSIASLTTQLDAATKASKTDNPMSRKTANREAKRLAERIQRLQAIQNGYLEKFTEQIMSAVENAEQRADVVIAMRERINEWREKFNLDESKLTVYESLDEVQNADARKQIMMGAETPGWTTGSRERGMHAYIYLPHVKDIAALDRTIMHEVVTHYGLKTLLGEKDYNTLMDKVWNMMSDSARRTMSFYPGVQYKEGDERRRTAAEEFIALVAEDIVMDKASAEANSLWKRVADAIAEKFDKMQVRLSGVDVAGIVKDNYARLEAEGKSETTAEEDATENTTANAEEVLVENGYDVDEQNGDVRFSSRYITNDAQREDIVSSIVDVTGRTVEEAERWLQSEESVASLVLADKEYLDYLPDDKYKAIKDNSDYPQGTVDFNNICRKRIPFTKMYTRLQRRYPNRIFTAEELADIRTIMSEDGLTVACGLCYVEDRRQQLGEVADEFIADLKDGFKAYAEKSQNKQSKAAQFLVMIGSDSYVPTIYDLITLEGSDKLYREHRGVWDAFGAYNRARGQQTQNTFQGYAEYKREILGWSKAKVNKVNSLGGLRVFSYSDFEAHHLLDLVQIIIDCAAKGVMIQGYTKVPEFARAVANTNIKLNRSLIPLGDTGIVDGQLAFDPVEGIDINDPNFLESNDNVGNILIGINSEQIRLAMADPRIHYIIPYHARQAGIIRNKLNVGAWSNYTDTQNERDARTGKRVAENINIYTDILGADVTNDREFVEKYLQKCKEMGRIPKFDEFLDKDAEGNYVYTPGYYKFLVDFKLFDENGNILPQKPVVAQFDDAFNMQILQDYAEGERQTTGEQMNATYDKIVETLGLNEEEAEGEDIRFKSEVSQDAVDSVLGNEDASFDRQGNPINKDGSYKVETVSSIDQITDEDFLQPSRNIILPRLSKNLDTALNGKGKDIIIKKNIFVKNRRAHEELSPEQSRAILNAALYSTNMYGKSQPIKRPNYWVAIKTSTPSSVVVIEVQNTKDYIEVVGWRNMGEKQLQELERQAKREGGQILILTSEEAAAGLSALPLDSSVGKDTNKSDTTNDLDGKTLFKTSNHNQTIFVSNAAKAVEGIQMGKATPEQWLKMLEKNGGLKAGEDKWMGLSDWLKASEKKTLTKQEVLDFVNEHMVQIEEVHYAANAESDAEYTYVEIQRILQDKFDDYMQEYYESHDVEDDYGDEARDFAMDKLHEEFNDEFPYTIERSQSDVYLTFPYEEVEDLEEWAAKVGIDFKVENPINDTRLNYTTEGLDNKREIALTVPSIESWGADDATHFGDAGDGRAVAWIRFGETSTEGYDVISKEAIAATKALEDFEDEMSTKYNLEFDEAFGKMTWEEATRHRELSEAEEVAHSTDIRINKGRKVLVIDEIQSKRHQEGREKGYKTAESARLLERANELSKQLAQFEDEMRAKYKIKGAYSTYELLPAVRKKGSEEDFLAYARLNQERNAAYSEYEASFKGIDRNAPYAAPFEKNWHELAMKRMLRYAAENGYDYIAWTKGDQQVERYDIGGVVSEITVKHVGDKGYEVESLNASGYSVLYGVYPDASAIADVYGKELAAKIVESVSSFGDKATIEGNNLRLGGEGMRGFYDQILPKFMDKYGKKWGVKTTDIELPNLEGGLTMHSVPVTEEMKESVMEGQTMFKTRMPNQSAESFALQSMRDYVSTYGNLTMISVMPVNDATAKELGYDSVDTLKDTVAEYLGKKGIAIFAHEDITDSDEYETAIYHESIHHLAKRYPQIINTGKYFWDNAEMDEALSAIKAAIDSKYANLSEEDKYEEMLCFAMEYFASDNKVEELAQKMQGEDKKNVELINSKTNYGKSRSSETISEDSRAREENGVSDKETEGEGGTLAEESGETLFKSAITPEVRKEMDVIAAQAIVNGNYLKAPNGKDTKLTPEQWALVRTQNFKEWFGDWENDPENASKVVDENGEPMVVYHGTASDFTIFEAGTNDESYRKWKVAHFGTKEQAEDIVKVRKGNKKIIPVFLNIRKPYRVADQEDTESWAYTANIAAGGMFANQNGDSADGLVYLNEYEGKTPADSYAVWNPNQIKSATENSGEYSEDEDIRFKIRTKPAPQNVKEVYKLMRLGADGRLYPLYIDSAEGIELKVWYDADSPNMGDIENLEVGYAYKIDKDGNVVEKKKFNKTAKGSYSALPTKEQIDSATLEESRWVAVSTYADGSKAFYNVGINGSGTSSLFGMRPGWHAGSLPTMRQIGKGSKKNLRDDSFVWVRGYIPADVDYQAEADANSSKDIQTHIPTDGYYLKATNANKKASQADKMGWYIAGAFYADEMISDAEARSVIDEWNKEHPDAKVEYDFPRESGREFDPARGGLVESDTMFKTDPSTMNIDELVEQGKQKVIAENKDAIDVFMDRIRAINGNLQQLRMAAAAQRQYDKRTVDAIVKQANELLEAGKLADLTRGEIKRILSVVNNATGKADLTKEVGRLMDIMIANQLRMGRENIDKFLRIRGKKVDQRGVEVRGRLDIKGQQIMDAIRENIGNDLLDILMRIVDVQEKLTSESETVRRNAENELVGLEFARQYVEDIKDSEKEEKRIRQEIKDAEQEYKDGIRDRKTFVDFANAANEAIRENRIQRVLAYQKLAEDFARLVTGSITNAKLLRDAEKERVQKIQHFANSDLQGLPYYEHGKVDNYWLNNPLVRFLLKPLATFDQMLRHFGSKNVNGEGYLWNHFMRGWLKATETEYKGVQAAHEILDAKAREVFRREGIKRWSDIFEIDRKLPSATVTWWDGGEMKDHEVTQGNLLYIYMVNKMTDGKMKLRKMGVTEEDVENIKDALDPRFVALADWIQDEFLPSLRDKYNALHEKLFGAPMAAIDSYFPIRVLANAREREVDLGVEESNARPSTITGSIIKRTRNSLALDILGSNAFDVVLDHIQQMEHWAAFAEFNQDLNTLLSYRRFRNRVQNMSGIYGSGNVVWNNFRSVAELAAGVYQPASKSDSIDKTALNLAKGVTAAKISFRVYTAMKQLLSMPAFISDARTDILLKNILTPWNAWKWSMENLPLFEKRWKSRQAGDSRLMQTDSDWKIWKSKVVELASRYGMSPNAFVDAVTVAIGARSIFETKEKEYKAMGYSDEEASTRAKQDATIIFNESQQSNESAFLSTMQVDRTVSSVAFSLFRNSAMGYQRMFVDALRNIKHKFAKDYKQQSIEFMQKQMIRDGVAEADAERAAKRMYARSIMQTAMRAVTFGFVVEFAWNLGAYLPYLIAGDDDDEKRDMVKDAARHALFGPIEGLSGGSLISEAGNLIASGEGLADYDPTLLPVVSDMKRLFSMLSYDEVAAANEMFNILLQAGIGVNPQTITDAAVAIIDACNGDLDTAKEATLCLLRILQIPQTQADKIYIDEIDFTADKGLELTIYEFAKRYADYKVKRGAPLTGWMYSDEKEKEREDKYIKRFTDMAEEYKRSRGNEEAKKYYEYLDTEYKEVTETIADLKSKAQAEGMKGNMVGAMEYAEMLDEFMKTEVFQRYTQYGGMAKAVEKLRDQLLKVDNPTMEMLEDIMLDIRKEMVEEMEKAND